MASTKQHRISLRAATVGLALAIVFVITVVARQAAQAQTLNVIHTFTGAGDGANPEGGVILDRAGDLYGTAFGGGVGYGIVYEITQSGSGWIVTPIYTFKGGNDGASPVARVILAPDGTLYGTTESGGGGSCNENTGCGTVFKLSPPTTGCASAICPWTETVLYRFSGGSDGALPRAEVVLDQSGNIYGTTFSGGSSNCGTVFKLTPSGSGWTESVLYSYPCYPGLQNDYSSPAVIFDRNGNLYGVTDAGGTYNQGTVFELVPSGSGWTANVLHAFSGEEDGVTPEAALMSDGSGNLYGSTTGSGPNGGGTVFELTPSGSNWTFAVLYSLPGTADLLGIWNKLVMDQAGNLYSTTIGRGAYGGGSVFELTHPGGVWTYTSLHDFTGGSDGWNPYANLVLDTTGNLYGTTFQGGTYGYGVAFEITP